MLDCDAFVDALHGHGVEFFAGVPDSLLKHLCACLEGRIEPSRHVIASNEGSAVALASGYHLATGRLGAVYLQNSGQGNMINPLLSLADPEVYGVPMLLIVGWRGEPGKSDEPQHRKQGGVTIPLFEAAGIPCFILPQDETESVSCLDNAIGMAIAKSRPVALLVKSDTFAGYEAGKAKDPFETRREDVLHELAGAFRLDDVVVSSTGKISRELYDIRVAAEMPLGQDFYTVGSMGHSSQIALGIALARPERQVFCLDGDGALIMHMGSLATIGGIAPRNFRHVVLNNGAHDSVGGQPTVGFLVDLPGIAAACGYSFTKSVSRIEDLPDAISGLRQSDGPGFLEVRVARGSRSDLGRPTTTPAENKIAFMQRLAATLA